MEKKCLDKGGHFNLTIYDYHKRVENKKIVQSFKLRYPNLEVEDSFKKYLLASLTQTSYRNAEIVITKLLHSLRLNNIEEFCATMRSFFAHIPYQLHIPLESYYHLLMQLLLTHKRRI